VTDGDVVDRLRQMDRLIERLRDILQGIADGGHPMAGKIVECVGQQCVPLAWATHVGHAHLEHPDRWEVGSFGVRARRARAARAAPGQVDATRPSARMRPIGDVGTLMTWADFLEGVEGGMLDDYDGFGELATADAVSRVEVNPSDAADLVRPDWATHVVWYNR